MATQQYGNESFVIENLLSQVCWGETLKQDRSFSYPTLLNLITFIRSGRARYAGKTYADAVTFAMDTLRVCEDERTVLRALLTEYFKLAKDATKYHPFDDKYWNVTVEEQTSEIFLYHFPSMTRTESYFTNRKFKLGSVTVEGRPCRQKSLASLHQSKGIEVTYQILSGR